VDRMLVATMGGLGLIGNSGWTTGVRRLANVTPAAE
jgi:hypothetical protein